LIENSSALTEVSLENILDLPGFFMCHPLSCKMRLTACLGRRQANRERRGFERLPYAECENCPQGERNEKESSKVDVVRCPRRGAGFRNLGCEFYDHCLGVAASREWAHWKCDSCDLVGDGFEAAETEDSLNRKKLCKECGQPATAGVFCGRCFSEKSKVARAKKAALKEDCKGNGNGRSTGRSSIQGQISQARNSSASARIINVDFGSHPELFDGLEILSRCEFRSMEGQILSLIACAVSRHSGATKGDFSRLPATTGD
jgi:hypothetical protein